MYYRNNYYSTAYKFIKTLNKKLKGCRFYLGNISEGSRTYVTKDLSIFIDTNDVDRYAKENSVAIDTAIKLLISHEIFHVVLGHFGKQYKDYDPNLLNIAGDLEINSYLGIQHPGITAADYGWSPLLDTKTYYNKLIELSESNKEDEELEDDEYQEDEEFEEDKTEHDKESETGEPSENDSDEIEDDESSEEYEDEDYDEDSDEERTNAEKFNDMVEEKYNIDIPEDVEINNATSDLLGEETIDVEISLSDLFNNKESIKEVINRMMRKELEKTNIYGLEKIINKLERAEKENTIQAHTKKATYYKLNNRRKSDFVLPGKRFEGGATKKKFDKSLTVFIDVSGSTTGTINTNLMKVAYRFYKTGANIVYYSDYIRRIIKANETFSKIDGCGCTDIVKVVKEYFDRVGPLERVYVFTDGRDDFKKMGEACDKYKIFYVGYTKNGMECYEQYSNRNPQK